MGDYAEITKDRDLRLKDQDGEDISEMRSFENEAVNFLKTITPNMNPDSCPEFQNQIGVDYDLPKKETINIIEKLKETDKSILIRCKYGDKWFSKAYCVFRKGFVHAPYWLCKKLELN